MQAKPVSSVEVVQVRRDTNVQERRSSSWRIKHVSEVERAQSMKAHCHLQDLLPHANGVCSGNVSNRNDMFAFENAKRRQRRSREIG